MVEVFKTNVNHTLQAKYVADVIVRSFEDCKVNFDLDDCDRILRVEMDEAIDVDGILLLMSGLGVQTEVLTDEVESDFAVIIT